ncbi:hypothetical protein [Rhodococcus sp. WAY2]|uniref:hypothetical protein n=1 Tax=Rhodococcus sp. WAY2 TaxID=2663121 RepID=UPI00131FC08D|nr:hypothetical protein [Rhodococcus sp. WAY2]QHE73497.1 hypothetical protein GFS60_07157 [Rhodococcus sp. WAY2]
MKTLSAFAVVTIVICGEVTVTLFGIAAAIAVVALAYMLLVDTRCRTSASSP